MKCDHLIGRTFDGIVYVEASQAMEAIAELKNENRKANRALWIARAELCRRLDIDRYLRNHRKSWYNKNCLTWDEACVVIEARMCRAKRICLKKAEEYK